LAKLLLWLKFQEQNYHIILKAHVTDSSTWHCVQKHSKNQKWKRRRSQTAR